MSIITIVTAAALAKGGDPLGEAPPHRVPGPGVWWWVAARVLAAITAALVCVSVVLIVLPRPLAIPVRTPFGPSHRYWACPSALEWVQGRRDSLCGWYVVRHDSLLALILLAFALTGVRLAAFASRRRKHIVEAWLESASDGHDIVYVDPPEALDDRLRELWRNPSRPRWLRRTGMAALGGFIVTLVLVPPFTPTNRTWRSFTEGVPWQVVQVVPWSPYPKEAQVTRTDDGDGNCRNTTIFAFGYVWGADAQVGPGTFRQLDRTHGVLNGVSFTGGVSQFSDLECVPIPAPPPRPPVTTLPVASQPPDPDHLVTTQDIEATAPGAAVVQTYEPPLATTATPGRDCVWNVYPSGVVTSNFASPDFTVDLTVSTAAASVAAGHAWGPFDLSTYQARLSGFPAHYFGNDHTSGLDVVTPTASFELELEGVSDNAALDALGRLVLARINTAGP